jgi:hypothetical protein
VDRLSFFIQWYLACSTGIPGISAIHIAGEATAQYCVVEACIELNAVSFCTTANDDAAEVFVPFLMGLLAGFLKAQGCRLRLQVQTGVFDGSVRKAETYGHSFLVASSKCKVHACSLSFDILFPGCLCFTAECTIGKRFLICHRRKVHGYFRAALILLNVSGQGDHITFDAAVRRDVYASVFHLTAFTLFVADVEQNMRVITRRKSKPLKCYALGCGHFGFNAVAFEQYSVIACSSFFVCTIESRTVAGKRIFEHSGLSNQCSFSGHE